jgi:hypothetical protein
MKKLLKGRLIMLALVLSFAACKGNKSAQKTDSVSTQDTIKHTDTTVKVDTIKSATDTSDMKTDTVSKTIHSKTEIKKISVKKTKQQ